MKLVVLFGRPGSGKSTLADLIMMRANDEKLIDERLIMEHIDDYTILYQMFKQEEEQNIPEGQRKFRATDQHSDAFDVQNFDVLDEALIEMKNKVLVDEQDNPGIEKSYILELARDDYTHVLDLFKSHFLEGSLIIYLDVDLDTCIERVHQRKQKFVSEDIMRHYYCQDDWEILRAELDGKPDIGVKVIKNTGSFEEIKKEAEQIITDLRTTPMSKQEQEKELILA